MADELVLYLDASEITGLSDNDPVSQWDDLSGLEHHAVQTESALQPVFKTDVLNGKPVVRFDLDELRVPYSVHQGALTVTEVTVFILVLVHPSSPGNNAPGIISTAPTGTHRPGYSIFHRGSVWEWRSGASGSHTDVNGPMIRDEFFTLTATIDDSTGDHVLYENGIELDSSSNSQLDADENPLQIGMWFNGRAFIGDIAEIRVYNYVLSTAEREAVETELFNKWFGDDGQHESGAASAEVIVSASGAGVATEHAENAAGATLTIAAAGSGTALEHASNSASASITVVAAGAGTATEQASSAAGASLVIAAFGDGTKAISAGADAGIIVSAVGAGSSAESATASAGTSLVVNAAGDGTKQVDDAASTAITIAAAGSGHAVVPDQAFGSANVRLTIAADGTGTKHAAANASTGIDVDVAGIGRKHVDDAAASGITVSAAGAGTAFIPEPDEGQGAAGVSITVAAAGTGVKHVSSAAGAGIAASASGQAQKQTSGSGNTRIEIIAAGAGSSAEHSSRAAGAYLVVSSNGAGVKQGTSAAGSHVAVIAQGQARTWKQGAVHATVLVIPAGVGWQFEPDPPEPFPPGTRTGPRSQFGVARGPWSRVGRIPGPLGTLKPRRGPQSRIGDD